MRLLGVEVTKAGAENRRVGETERQLSQKYHVGEKKGWRERAINLLRRGQKQQPAKEREQQPASSQTREYWDTPFANTFNAYQPFKFNLDLYDTIRESIPVCDVAIIKLCRLIGDFTLTADNDADLELLNTFKQKVKVNHFERGFNAVRSQVTDSALAKGMGFFEVIPTRSLSDIYRLKVARANEFRFIKDKEKDRLILGQVTAYNDFRPVSFENQDYIHYLAFDRRDGHPQGFSLFYSLPFVSQITSRILKSLENQVWRLGDPSFFFIVEKGGESQNYALAKAVITGIQSQGESVMRDRKQGKVRDVYGALPGEATLRVQAMAGKEALMDIQIPMRTVLEQIVARTHLPPFMFGLSWSTTERLSTHQNDMIISLIESYREDWNPIIEKVFETFLALQGRAGMKWGFEWNRVNLMDEVEMANARWLSAQSAEKEILNLTMMMSYGWIEADEVIDTLVENGVISRKIVARLGQEAVVRLLHQATKERRAGEILARILSAARSSGNGYHEVERYREMLISDK